MSTLLNNAPTQDQVGQWEENRIGRFTASVIGKLMSRPKSLPFEIALEHWKTNMELECGLSPYTTLKSGSRKGQEVPTKGFGAAMLDAMEEAGLPVFGDTALALISSKAAERYGQKPAPVVRTKSMDRGSLLEHAARILLSRYWRQIDGTTFHPYGKNGGATPDGLTDEGLSSWQVKCPEDPGDLMLFAASVPHGDFEAFERWNKVYAWQAMMEAKATGCSFAQFTMFTDRLVKQAITDDERQEVQDVMDAVANAMGERLGYPMWYRFESNGFAHITRRFELTEERSKKIDRVLQAAEVECEKFMLLMSE